MQFTPPQLMDGAEIRTVQELLGHTDVRTTMIYTHVLVRPDVKVRSPLDTLGLPCESIPDAMAPAT